MSKQARLGLSLIAISITVLFALVMLFAIGAIH